MEEENFLNRAAIVHCGMAARYCYYTAIHFFFLEYILHSDIIIGKGGDDRKSVTIERSMRRRDKIRRMVQGRHKTSVGYQYRS